MEEHRSGGDVVERAVDCSPAEIASVFTDDLASKRRGMARRSGPHGTNWGEQADHDRVRVTG